MTRPASDALIAAASAHQVRPFFAVELLYPAGPVRLCSLPLPVTIGGQVYQGTGALGEISALEEGSENRSYGFTLQLSGIPGNWAEYLRSQDVQGGLVTVHLGFVNAQHTVIGTHVITVGRMDTQDVQAGATTAVLVSCESIGVDWERARARYCTDADQRAQHPTDGFFRYQAALENQVLTWGK